MKFSGIDLHSNNSVVVISDEVTTWHSSGSPSSLFPFLNTPPRPNRCTFPNR
jgi:hypothetical protein